MNAQTLTGRMGSVRPVLLAFALGAALHLLWFFVVSNGGGDLAAQDAWAQFVRLHPDSAYDLSWYGGLYPVSYSAVSPYVMALLGVRPTIMIAGTVSTALLALILQRVGTRRLWIPATYGALALFGNAMSGRVTFGLGLMFALGAVAVLVAWPDKWWADRTGRLCRTLAIVILGVLSTTSSPVAGLFLGVVAAALWLSGRHRAAYAVGLPPAAVVVASAVIFPFSGVQPMSFNTIILPALCTGAIVVLAPSSWRVVRFGSLFYLVGLIAVWLIPSPIGTNMTRLALIFSGVVLLAIATHDPRRWRDRVFALVVASSVLTATGWQVGTAAADTISMRITGAWTAGLSPLVHELRSRSDLRLGRLEVVPARSHREANTLVAYANLARGWNRQADAERNPLFYGLTPLTAATYRAWLDRWAVRYVALPRGPRDVAGVAEARLIRHGLPYLTEVWSSRTWRLYAVQSPAPLVAPPAQVLRFNATHIVVRVMHAGDVVIRVPASPWLTIVDAQGAPYPNQSHGCLTAVDVATGPDQAPDHWLVLRAPAAGRYRIGSPYEIPRGSPCPTAPAPGQP